jgi:DNA repair photolyase
MNSKSQIIVEPSTANWPANATASETQTRKVMNGKPVFEIDVKAIINLHSKFEEKLLCDGLSFSAGTACGFKCAFCFVEAQHARNAPVQNLLKEKKLAFEDIVIRRANPLQRVEEILTKANGKPRFSDPADTRVIYASPLVDVAANMTLVQETILICHKILELTHWHIRLLSKSHLLPKIAEALEAHKERLIFGVSTGTLNNDLAASFEQGTALVSKRIESLHWLQDHGFRTFGMICPSLPQTDYDEFAREMADAIRVDRCEHVWAEVMNVRGDSLNSTITALHAKGFMHEAAELAKVYGAGAADRWEEYARATFLAHTKVIPSGKLRFLQYVNPRNCAWWRGYEDRGAVLLGKHAEMITNTIEEPTA